MIGEERLPAADLLAQVTGLPIEQSVSAKRARRQADFVLTAGGRAFVVEVKKNTRSSTIASAIDQLRSYLAERPNASPLLIVPKMGEAGATQCAVAGVNWIDASGNASIDHDNLIVRIRGNSSRLAPKVTGFNPFSRKASRAIQALLLQSRLPWSRQQLEVATDLDKGFISKIVSSLLQERYIQEEGHIGRKHFFRVRNPLMLLDAWSERYERVAPYAYGLIASKDGFASLQQVEAALRATNVQHAFTGLSAAAAYTRFGSFRRVSLYVASHVPPTVLDALHVENDSRGRNVVISIDDGNARIGQQTIDGIRYASPVLTYLDLASEPERSGEARSELRSYLEKSFT